MSSLKIFTIITVLATTQAYAQQKDIYFPIEVDTLFQGIKTKLIVREIITTPRESFADVVIGFYNPVSDEWVFFDAPETPFSRNGFVGSFKLRLINKLKGNPPDLEFLGPIIKPDDEGTYRWRCECNEILKRIM